MNKKKRNKSLKIFIQINIGNENQKSGIDKNNLNDKIKSEGSEIIRNGFDVFFKKIN